METISVNQDSTQIKELVDRAIEYEKPLLLESSVGNAILISQKSWNAIQETLYLQSIPGMAESIKEGGKMTIEDCVDELTVKEILNG
ncbi:type II toxin-antitoxin system Phd/YefM family antitoxin [Roseofilum casamattae]|uniref:Antitoxin n=1 Tax=Roseofilum casamattae BLCC-M143 TaxID=3022442 RepID=A0ABT7BUD8_9CYAN|nr:type II toxin-antitoxin system Phd/YefM family antitoxin [Roseofilum casamattae]MDJ1182805.1 type II toxin-antitoxin system Phd/YefM family antitoxin [Roseofilum casamattae BLCC-M143]